MGRARRVVSWRVVLIGDAARADPPHIGPGGCVAVHSHDDRGSSAMLRLLSDRGCAPASGRDVEGAVWDDLL